MDNTTICPTAGGARVSRGDVCYAPLASFRCRVALADGKVLYFDEAETTEREIRTGLGSGFARAYRFEGGLEIETRVWVDYEGDVRFELIPISDGEIKSVLWPAPFENERASGRTALPVMQGCLVDNFDPRPLRMRGGHAPCSRGMTMRFFGQYDDLGGYIAILDTGFDGGLDVDAPGNASVHVGCEWYAQRGKIGEPRRMRVRLLPKGGDYNDIAAAYRAYIKRSGALITLRDKIARNPRAAYYIGAPVVHTVSYMHIEPCSVRYNADDPASNDRVTTFGEVGEKLKRLSALGAQKAILHLDGWQRRGYDNLHPDALPPSEKAGGWDGFRRLADTCRALGFRFGLHDQYRDYYFDCDSFDLDNAARKADGTYDEYREWWGGRQTVLCARLAPDYVSRNYDEIARHGLVPDNVYLDVFTVVDLDECANPAHPMTRAECARARAACYEELASRGIVMQGEELVDWATPNLFFVHHAPFALDEDWTRGKAFGRAIPLQELVYHDCLVTPFFPQVGGFGIPDDVDGGLLSLLYGAGVYLPDDADEKTLARVKEICAWQEKVQTRPMLRHEFLEGRKEKCAFEGGYEAEVDFGSGAYRLTDGEKD